MSPFSEISYKNNVKKMKKVKTINASGGDEIDSSKGILEYISDLGSNSKNNSISISSNKSNDLNVLEIGKIEKWTSSRQQKAGMPYVNKIKKDFNQPPLN